MTFIKKINGKDISLDVSAIVQSVQTSVGWDSEIDNTDPLNPKVPPRALPCTVDLVQTNNWTDFTIRTMQGITDGVNCLFVGQTTLAENGWYVWNGSSWVMFNVSNVNPLSFANEYNRIYSPLRGDNIGKAYWRNRTGNTPYYQSIGGSGVTNLGYTSSSTNGIVTSDTGIDATIPLATPTAGTNLAGLLSPADKTKLDNTTNTNSGDNATNTSANSYADAKVADTITDGVITVAPSQNAVFDALSLKADKQNSLTSGGLITVGTFGGSGTNNDIRVAPATWYINPTSYTTVINTDFLDIALSSAGNQRYVGIFGSNTGVISKVEGTEAALASYPTTPANNIVIGYVLVGDAVVDTTPDLSGYMLKSDKASQSSNTTGTNDTTYVTPLANVIKQNILQIKSASFSALNDNDYVVTGTLTVTEPTPITGKGYSVLVVTGTATINSVAYSVAGTKINRFYNGSAWITKVENTFNDATSSIQTQLNSKENTTNKTTTIVGNEASNTMFPTINAVYNWVVASFATIANLNLKMNLSMVARSIKLNKTSSTANGIDGGVTDLMELMAGATTNSGTGTLAAVSTTNTKSIAFTLADAVRGFAGGTDGAVLFVQNQRATVFVLNHEDGVETAANRIFTGGQNLGLGTYGSVILQYKSSNSRWNVVAVFGGVYWSSLAGSGNRAVEVDANGVGSATKAFIDLYITDSTNITNLENVANWTSGVYGGTAIAGETKGKVYYGTSYMYVMITNSTPKRLLYS